MQWRGGRQHSWLKGDFRGFKMVKILRFITAFSLFEKNEDQRLILSLYWWKFVGEEWKVLNKWSLYLDTLNQHWEKSFCLDHHGIALDDLILEISLSLSYCGFPTKGFVSHKVDQHPTDGLHWNHDQILYKGRHLVKHESKANSSVLSSLNSLNVFLWDTVTARRTLLFVLLALSSSASFQNLTFGFRLIFSRSKSKTLLGKRQPSSLPHSLTW